LLTRIWRDTDKDPRKSFEQWLRAFTAECSKSHPPTPPDQAARALRGDVERRLDPADLARKCGCSPQSLRREFRRQYAMSPREYHHLARLARMLPLIFAGRLKNEAIAAEVGYRSKKDLYKYFKRLTGMRPSDFKRLTREDADALLLRTRSRLLQRLTTVTPLQVDGDRIRRKPVPVRKTS
jgi:AraC-like DNA-binding protein